MKNKLMIVIILGLMIILNPPLNAKSNFTPGEANFGIEQGEQSSLIRSDGSGTASTQMTWGFSYCDRPVYGESSSFSVFRMRYNQNSNSKVGLHIFSGTKLSFSLKKFLPSLSMLYLRGYNYSQNRFGFGSFHYIRKAFDIYDGVNLSIELPVSIMPFLNFSDGNDLRWSFGLYSHPSARIKCSNLYVSIAGYLSPAYSYEGQVFGVIYGLNLSAGYVFDITKPPKWL